MVERERPTRRFDRLAAAQRRHRIDERTSCARIEQRQHNFGHLKASLRVGLLDFIVRQDAEHVCKNSTVPREPAYRIEAVGQCEAAVGCDAALRGAHAPDAAIARRQPDR